MERLADFSLLCVSAVLIVALVVAPPASPRATVAAAPAPAAEDEPTGTEQPVVAKDDTRRPTEVRADDQTRRVIHTGPWTERLGHSPRTPRPEMTPEFIDLCLAVAADVDEELATRLWELKKENPEELEAALLQSRRLISLAELRQRDPELYRVKSSELAIDADVRRLSSELRQAMAEGRTEDIADLEYQLENTLFAQWAYQFKARDEYICRLQDLLHQMEQQLEYDRANRYAIIATRLKDLKQEPQPRRSDRRGPTLDATDDPDGRRPRGRGRGKQQPTELDAED